MKTMYICSAIVGVPVAVSQFLFIFGCFQNVIVDAKQNAASTSMPTTMKSLFADADLGVNVKINDKGLIYCSGLTCSNKTVGCKIMQMPDKQQILKQCLGENNKILKELKEIFEKRISRDNNTTILVFTNGTNIVYNGAKPNPDVVLKTVDTIRNSVKDMFSLVFHNKVL